MHAGRVEPDKERLFVAVRTVDKVNRGRDEFLVDRFHALPGKGPGILAFLFAPRAKARVVARGVGRGRDTFQNTARTKLRLEGGGVRIIGMLGFLLGVQVIEIAEELVETVYGGQELVAVS